MKIRDPEQELQKRRDIITKIFSQSEKDNSEENERIREYNQRNRLNILNLYSEATDLSLVCTFCSEALSFFRQLKSNFKKTDLEVEVNLNQEIRKVFTDIFDKARVNALVNLLQPNNTRVYKREGIESLQFEKSEILKGFEEEEIAKEGINEVTVKILFWVNKLTKLTQLLEIEKLKSKPITRMADENYYSAQKRCEIIDIINNLYKEDGKILQNEIADRYEEVFGVKIEDDIETLKEIKCAKSSLYSIKNSLMIDFMINYFEATKRGEELKGIQGMGIKQNDNGFADSVDSYLAVIRLKGYATNVYLHIPYVCVAEAAFRSNLDMLQVKVPQTIYSKSNPNKVIPVNVLCKVERGSKRYAAIKKEAEENRDNEALKQALLQIKGKDIPGYSKSKWENRTIKKEELGLG